MKIQGELNGIKIDIECPEIVRHDGKWWEPVEFRRVREGDYYLWKDDIVLACGVPGRCDFRDNYDLSWGYPILRLIPEPTQEWLERNGYVKSVNPEKLQQFDWYWNGVSKECVDGWPNSSKGKYRFKLALRPVKTADEHAREYAQAFLKNEITAGQLLTKLEGMK